MNVQSQFLYLLICDGYVDWINDLNQLYNFLDQFHQCKIFRLFDAVLHGLVLCARFGLVFSSHHRCNGLMFASYLEQFRPLQQGALSASPRTKRESCWICDNWNLDVYRRFLESQQSIINNICCDRIQRSWLLFFSVFTVCCTIS